MSKFGFIEMLRILRKDELRKFRAFVKNEQFNKDNNCRRLMAYVAPYYPDFDSPALSKEYIYVKVFEKRGKLAFVDVVNSRLKRLLEIFLVIEEVQSNRVTQREILISLLSNRGVQKPLQKLLTQTRALHEKTPDRSLDYVSKKYALERQQFELMVHEESRGAKFDIGPLNEIFEQYIALHKLIFAVEVVNAASSISNEVNFEEIESLLAEVKNKGLFKLSPIKVYYHILNMLKDQSYEDFRAAVEIIHIRGEELPKKERVFLFTTCTTYCINKWLAGDSRSMEELFEIYQKMIETDALYIGDYMPPGRFKNIVTVGCRLGEFDWTEAFIVAYKSKVPEKFVQGNFQFSMAVLAFYKKDFDQTIKLLGNLKPLDFYYQVSSRLLLAKAYFLKRESVALHNYLQSFKTYTQKNQSISSTHKSAMLAFIKFVGKIDASRSKLKDKNELNSLIEKISTAKKISDKQWLLEQVNRR